MCAGGEGEGRVFPGLQWRGGRETGLGEYCSVWLEDVPSPRMMSCETLLVTEREIWSVVLSIIIKKDREFIFATITH